MTTVADVLKELLTDWHSIKDMQAQTGATYEGVRMALKHMRHHGIKFNRKRSGLSQLYKLRDPNAPQRGGNAMAEGKMPATYYVREALLDFSDPASAERDKVMAAAQSLARAAGETFTVTNKDVHNARGILARRFNGAYTAADIRAYQDSWHVLFKAGRHIHNSKGKRISTKYKPARMKVAQAPAIEANAYSLNDFFDLVKAARAFVQRAGGRSKAVQLIDVLQGD